LTREQAEEVIKGIDVLPASKRKPKETLLTMEYAGMTHTEFPNHQMNVLMACQEPNFNIKDYNKSVLKEPDPEMIHRLAEEWGDIKSLFAEAYQLTPSQIEALKKAGITNAAAKYGNHGVEPTGWATFGSTVKTMNEFSKSYMQFKNRCAEFVKKGSTEK
jgi:hypothetical protein